MVNYALIICWLLLMNCLQFGCVWSSCGVRPSKIKSNVYCSHYPIQIWQYLYMYIAIKKKICYGNNFKVLNCPVFLTLTLVNPFIITCIAIWSWKRNMQRYILWNNGIEIENFLENTHFDFVLLDLTSALIYIVHCLIGIQFY